MSAGKLKAFPELGRIADRKDIRLFPVSGTNYILIYQITGDAVVVASVVDGRMERDPDLW